MELSNEQYIQVLQYTAGEMNAEEQAAFEVELADNAVLSDEVAYCKKLHLLATSARQKLSDSYLFADYGEVEDPGVPAMINKARRNWEIKYEDLLKLKHGVSAFNTASPASEIDTEKAPAIHRTLKWVAAAVVIGLITFGIIWFEPKKNLSSITTNEVTVPVADTPASEVSKNVSPKHDEAQLAPQKNNTKPEKAKYRIDIVKRNALFTANFRTDTAPTYIPRHLRDPLDHYNNSDYKGAVVAFDQSEELITRGSAEDESLAGFYALYYKALSYLALDSANKALPLLKLALAKSTDRYWQAKAQWYLALCNLKKGDVKETKELLNLVIKNNEAGEYRQYAKKLLDEINAASVVTDL